MPICHGLPWGRLYVLMASRSVSRRQNLRACVLPVPLAGLSDEEPNKTKLVRSRLRLPLPSVLCASPSNHVHTSLQLGVYVGV
jgi:hypothetical protein